MNKQLRFDSKYIPVILSGEKTSTWVVFDDQNLVEGDLVDCINNDDQQTFANGKIEKITTKEFLVALEIEKKNSYLQEGETYTAADVMYTLYKKQYGDKFDSKTPIKIIDFILT
jgi:hypothetical protein